MQSRQIRIGSAENEQAGPPICSAAALHAALLQATSIGLLFSKFTLNALSLSYGLPIRQQYGWRKKQITGHGKHKPSHQCALISVVWIYIEEKVKKEI